MSSLAVSKASTPSVLSQGREGFVLRPVPKDQHLSVVQSIDAQAVPLVVWTDTGEAPANLSIENGLLVGDGQPVRLTAQALNRAPAGFEDLLAGESFPVPPNRYTGGLVPGSLARVVKAGGEIRVGSPSLAPPPSQPSPSQPSPSSPSQPPPPAAPEGEEEGGGSGAGIAIAVGVGFLLAGVGIVLLTRKKRAW